jgi:hypothetical protein
MDAYDLKAAFELQNIPVWRDGDEVRFDGDVPPKLLRNAKAIEADFLKVLPVKPPARREILEPESVPLESVMLEDWPARQDLPEPPSVATMPPEMLPDSLRAWIDDAARLACVPLEIVAVNAVCAASGVIGASITVKAREGFYVTPNVWGGGVAPSGSMKSAMLKAATEPVRALEAKAERESQSQSEDHEIESDRARTQLDILKKSYETGKPPGKHMPVATSQNVKDARKDVRELEASKPTERTYTTTNSTHEALGMLLEQNAKGLTVVRDELAPFIANMNREDMQEARGFFNAGWDGSVPYTYHRVTRGRVRLARVCVAICGMMQPKLLDALMAAMLDDPMQNDGFLQRFQLLVYPDTYPKWIPPEQQAPPAPDALEDAVKVFERLDALEQYNDQGELEPRLIGFSHEAQATFNDWHDALEREIRPGGELEKDTAFKSWYAKSKSLLVSLAAIFHLCNLAATTEEWDEHIEPISLDALNLALDWTDYLTEHARKVYRLELDPGGHACRIVAELLEQDEIKDGQKVREVKRKYRTLGSVIDSGLDVLEKLGWVKLEDTSPEGAGRPSFMIRVHPDLRSPDSSSGVTT